MVEPIDNFFWEDLESFLTSSVSGTYKYVGQTDDGLDIIDVEGSVICRNWISYTTLPIAFNYVSGDFVLPPSITSLKGCPKYVGGNFSCTSCNITSLQYAPIHVGGTFLCDCTAITNLIGSPIEVGESFICSNNLNLVSFKGASCIVGGAFVGENIGVESTKYLPRYIGRSLVLSSVVITDVGELPNVVGDRIRIRSLNDVLIAT